MAKLDFLEIEAGCPECGAPVVWLEHQRLNRCTFCGSALFFDYTQRDCFYLPPTVSSSEQIKEILVFSKAEKKRAERMARDPGLDEEKAPEMLSVFKIPLEPFLNEFRAKIFLKETRLIYVPYWHLQATLLQCLLATDKSGAKHYTLRRAFVDETLPAYDPDRWNFRDRGLRFGKVRLKEVTKKLLSGAAHIAFVDNFHSQIERIAQAHPPMEGEAFYLFKFHSLCKKERLPVLRPYWFVVYDCDQTETALLDAAFGSVAGYPKGNEKSVFLTYKDKPLAENEPPKIRVISSRCPVCGEDAQWEAKQKVHFCKNCKRALILRAGEVESMPYQYASGESKYLFIPFWRFKVRLDYRNKRFDSLRPYYQQFFPERLLQSVQFGDHLSIPAVQVVQERRGDLLLSALIADGCSQVDLLEGTLPYNVEIESCTVDVTEASEMLHPILPTASGVHPTLHKSGTLVQMLKQTQIEMDKGSLVLLPYALDGENLCIGRQRFSRHLLHE